ncbi:MAG: hypothetical protein EBX52_11870 [Proteobacteria bacterium]|nr:hypothetical protein [Pseudomonadota bacterium]
MRFAGFWIRFWAHWMDFIIWNAIEFALEWGITQAFHLDALGEQIAGVVLTLLVVYLYYVEIPIRKGTTFGKRLFGIRVYNRNTGMPFTRRQATIRTAAYLLSYAPVGAGFLMVLFHPSKLALHDLVAGTASLRKSKAASDPTAPVKTA